MPVAIPGILPGANAGWGRIIADYIIPLAVSGCHAVYACPVYSCPKSPGLFLQVLMIAQGG